MLCECLKSQRNKNCNGCFRGVGSSSRPAPSSLGLRPLHASLPQDVLLVPGVRVWGSEGLDLELWDLKNLRVRSWGAGIPLRDMRSTARAQRYCL